MPLLRSQLTARIEQAINSLGWAFAAPDKELLAALPTTTPIAVAWRWSSIAVRPAANQPGMGRTPMQKDLTYTIEYAAQVARGAKQDSVYKYLALDLPDMLAAALLDPVGPLFAVIPGPTGSLSSVMSVVMNDDAQRPPPLINAVSQVTGYLSFTVRAQIDARTSLAIEENEV